MVKRGASIGFFGLFGRSQDMRLLDEALRQAGLHPGAVSEGAKLATVTLMSRDKAHEPPPAASEPDPGQLLPVLLLRDRPLARLLELELGLEGPSWLIVDEADKLLAQSFQGLGSLPGGTSSHAMAVSGDGAVVVGHAQTPAGERACVRRGGPWPPSG
jgi:hypothetical protein